MGAFAVPFATESFIESSWVFVFAIPPVLVAAFFEAYRPRTRRSLLRLGIDEAVTLAMAGGFILLNAYASRGDGVWSAFIILATLVWSPAFVGQPREWSTTRRDVPRHACTEARAGVERAQAQAQPTTSSAPTEAEAHVRSSLRVLARVP